MTPTKKVFYFYRGEFHEATVKGEFDYEPVGSNGILPCGRRWMPGQGVYTNKLECLSAKFDECDRLIADKKRKISDLKMGILDLSTLRSALEGDIDRAMDETLEEAKR